jgi:hypothetical protein
MAKREALDILTQVMEEINVSLPLFVRVVMENGVGYLSFQQIDGTCFDYVELWSL